MARVVGKAVVGKVVKVNSLWKAAKVSVQHMKLDVNTNVYINNAKDFWASDPDMKTAVGDLVLVQPLATKPRVEITHHLKEVVFHSGALVEPITGKRCRGTEYIDEQNRNLN